MIFNDLLIEVETYDLKKLKLIKSNIEKLKKENKKIGGMSLDEMNQLYEKIEKLIGKK